MLGDIAEMLLSLIKTMSVVIVLTYVITQTRLYDEILEKKLNIRSRLLLIVIFGLFSIFGTLSGIPILDAIANIRDLGPAIAGLIGGPLVGVGAGLIGGLHRMTLGGITAVPCSLSTVLAGLAGGLIYRYLKGEFIGIRGATVFAFLVESFHMGITLLLARPFDEALIIVRQVSAPMIIANTLGMAIFAFIFVNVSRERRTASEKKKMESELQIAREIQMSIVPKIFPPFPERSDFNLYAVLEPAREVGGDLFDFYLSEDESKLFFTVGDVSGKGVPASLFMAVTKTLLKAKTTTGLTPDETLAQVNNELCQGNESAMFATVFMGALDVNTGYVEYGNGGHNLPYIIRGDGNLEQVSGFGNMALGVMEDMPYRSGQTKLNNSDKLVIYTDGVTEAQDIRGNLFLESRFEDFLKKNSGAAPQELIELLVKEIEEFAEGAEPADDITVLVLEFTGNNEKTLNLTLKNDLAEITRLSEAVEDYGQKNQLDKKTVFNINLALEEIVTNIITHGYKDSTEEEYVDIAFDLQNGNLQITVTDHAAPFNPLEMPEPDTSQPLEDRDIGGMGIHLVKNVMDNLDYRRENNANVLILTRQVG